jgi:integrase
LGGPRRYADSGCTTEAAERLTKQRRVFSDEEVTQILEAGETARDRLALRLLLVYGLRRSSLQRVQLGDLDPDTRVLTIWQKGGTYRELPIVEEEFWTELKSLSGSSEHYLIPKRKSVFGSMRYYPTSPMGHNGLHRWWYQCLERAGLVAPGVTSGERMHNARHTSGQRILNRTKGNLKATQMLLGHKSIVTTANVYTSWDIDQLRETMREVTA